MLEFNPIFEIYNTALFFNYRQINTEYDNTHFNERYHSLDWWFVRIGFDNKLFDIQNHYYDGCTLKEIIVLGFSFGYGYNYIAKPIADNLFDK